MDHRDTNQAKAPLDLVCFWVVFIFLHKGTKLWLFTEIAVFDFLPEKVPTFFLYFGENWF